MRTLLLTLFIISVTSLANAQFDNEYNRDIESDYLLNTNSENESKYIIEDEFSLKAAPVNDACSNATEIAVGDPLICNQTTRDASFDLGESRCSSGGTPQTVWYRFTAVNDSVVLSFIETNNSNCSPYVAVYGPFDPGTGCNPNTSSNIVCEQMASTDQGLHRLITDLIIDKSYLIQIEGRYCNGVRYTNFCIGIANPALNTTAEGASLIDACGTGFNGNTSLGNYPSGSSVWSRNIDHNNSTEVSGAINIGDDVTYHINNDSWFYFTPIIDGTWSITIDGITNCHLTTSSNGIQSSVFIGTPTNLTNVYNFPSPMLPGTSNTSIDISASAGENVYILIDGWAGDACDYVLTLSNITGGCKVSPLPVELLKFNANNKNRQVELNWQTASEINNDYFTIRKSVDGKTFKSIGTISGAGNSNYIVDYSFTDSESLIGTTYYQLKQTDFNGKFTYSHILAVNPHDISTLSDLSVTYDNTSDNLTVTFNSSSSDEYTIEIYSITGQKVFEDYILTDNSSIASYTLQTSNIKQGMYSLVVNSAENRLSQKIVVNHK